MDSISIIYFIIATIICFTALCLITWFNRKHNVIWRALQNASSESRYNPTVFIIYDDSTATNCNRLINVQPFDWWVWACNDELYVLNPEGGLLCPGTTSPAVRILDNQYLEICMNVNFDSIINIYKKFKPTIVNYTIPTDSKTFTILSVLNILVKEYVTFDAKIADKKNLIHELDTSTSSDTRLHYDHLTGRSITSSTLQTLTSPTTTSLVGQEYRKHVQYDGPSLNLNNDNVFITSRT